MWETTKTALWCPRTTKFTTFAGTRNSRARVQLWGGGGGGKSVQSKDKGVYGLK